MRGYITIADFAEELRVSKNALRRYVIKHGFQVLEVRPPGSRGQVTHALAPQDATAIRKLRRNQGYEGPDQYPVDPACQGAL